MSAHVDTTSVDEEDLDRIRELASIGAGHAANALAQMLGRPCAMQVPKALPLDAGLDAGPDRLGLFFELEGGPGGMVALIFGPEVRARLIDMLLGRGVDSDDQAESALRELGNILVSHVASSIADTTGTAVLPSVPRLSMHDASDVLERLLAARRHEEAAIRLETEIEDRSREIHGRLVFVPADLRASAPHRSEA